MDAVSQPVPMPARSIAPLVPGWPFVGVAFELLKDPCDVLVRNYNRFGPVFRARAFGRELTVLAGPEANRFFAKNCDRFFRNGELFQKMSGELGTGHYLSALDGSAHRDLRRKLKPGFSREAISTSIPEMIGIAERIARSWRPGAELRVLETMQQLVVEQAARAMTGSEVGERAHDVATFAKTLIASGAAFRPKLLFYFPPYRAAKARFDRFLDRVIADHRAERPNGSRRPDFIDTVLAASDPQGRPLDDAGLKASAHSPYVNSIMYPSRTCAFLLYELIKNPAILARVTEEVDEAFANGIGDAAALRRLRLLRAATLEALRLYPIALSLPRRVVESFDFEGCRVEAGTTVLIGTTVSHFLPRFFPEPYAFDIDRYLAPRNEHFQTGAFVPFGIGSHACISAGVVEALIMTTMAALLHTARFELAVPGYVLKKLSDPVPGPEVKFGVRVVEHRHREEGGEGRRRGSETELADLLPDLNRERLMEAAARLKHEAYPAGATIIREGDPADRFYLLTKGQVEVVKEQAGAEPRLVATLSAGEYFGEIGILQGVPRTATVRACSPSGVEVSSLDRETFIDVVSEADLTSAEISRLLRRRILATNLAMSLPALSLDQVNVVSARFDLVTYAPGAEIVRQGDPADRFFIITRGRVEVSNRHPSGGEIHIGSLGAGDFFGEAGLLQGRPRNATVRAAADGEVEVMALGREEFHRLMTDSQETNAGVALVMCQRLVALAEKRGHEVPGP
jgi:cytochrome P450/CRP-like cAMP-binding protein